VSAGERSSVAVSRASMSGRRSWQLDRPRRRGMRVATPGRRRSRGTLWPLRCKHRSARCFECVGVDGESQSRGAAAGSLLQVQPQGAGGEVFKEGACSTPSSTGLSRAKTAGAEPRIWLGGVSTVDSFQSECGSDGREWRRSSAATTTVLHEHRRARARPSPAAHLASDGRGLRRGE